MRKLKRNMRKLKRKEIPRPSAGALASLPRHPVTAVLEDIRSIHNVGSIFRTADATRLERLVLTGITGTPAHRKLRKSSLGAERTVPWQHEDAAVPTVQRLQSDGYTALALEITDAPASAHDVSLDDYPVCLLLGNELEGVSEEAMELADGAIGLPQFGHKQSLNVSVAFGVAAYDLVRRYRRLAGLPPRFAPQAERAWQPY